MFSIELDRFSNTVLWARVRCSRILWPTLCLCLIIKKFEIVCPFVPLAIVFVFTWTWGDAFLRRSLKSFICFFPHVCSARILYCLFFELIETEVYVSFFMDVGSWTDLKRSYNIPVNLQKYTYFDVLGLEASEMAQYRLYVYMDWYLCSKLWNCSGHHHLLVSGDRMLWTHSHCKHRLLGYFFQ